MKEINFYCIEEDVNIFLYTFLSKFIEKEKKVMLYSEDKEKMQKINEMLWNQKKVGFLPHLLIDDEGAENTPILLSNIKENKYNLNFLLITTFLNDENFLNSFEKIFYIFTPINLNIINETKKSWENFKQNGFILKNFRKDSTGKWTESSDFSNISKLI